MNKVSEGLRSGGRTGAGVCIWSVATCCGAALMNVGIISDEELPIEEDDG